MSFPGPGHCGKTGVPIWSAAPWPGFAPPWANLLDHESSINPGYSIFRGHRQNLLRFPSGELLGGTWLAEVTFPMMTLAGITMG